MKRVKGHPMLRHTGSYVINTDEKAYQASLNKLKREDEVERLKTDVHNLKTSIDDVNDKLNLILKVLHDKIH